MKSNNHRFEHYIEDVLKHIKSRAGKKIVKQELIAHLDEKTTMFIKQGISQQSAVEQAITEMGDPIILGREMNKLHQPRTEWSMIILFIAILVVSLLPMYTLNVDYTGVFQRTLFFTIGAFIIGMSIMFFHYEKLKRHWKWFFVIGIGLLCTTLIFGDGSFHGQNKLLLFGITVDMLLTLISFFIAWAGMLACSTNKNMRKFIYYSFLLLIPLYLFWMIPDFFYSMMYIVLVFSLIIFSKENKKFVFSFVSVHSIVLISLLLIRIARSPYLLDRIDGFFRQDELAGSFGYFYVIIREGLSSARWIGAATEDYLSLIPALHADFIFVYIVLTFGWLVAAAILSLFIILFIRIGMVAFKTTDLFGKLLVVGGMSLFFSTFAWNIGMVLGILPIMSATFPFLSYGGNQQILYGLILGLILSVYRRSHLQKETFQTFA